MSQPAANLSAQATHFPGPIERVCSGADQVGLQDLVQWQGSPDSTTSDKQCYGVQIVFSNGAKISFYTTGNINPQGKHADEVNRLIVRIPLIREQAASTIRVSNRRAESLY